MTITNKRKQGQSGLRSGDAVRAVAQRPARPGKIRRSVSASTAFALLVGSAALVAGCANHSERHFKVGSVQDHYRTRHPIVIDEKEQTLDVPVATEAFKLTLPQASSVEGFAFRYRKSGAGVITVMMPANSPNQAAARKIGSKIVDVLYKAGVPGHRVSTVTYNANEHGPTPPVRLSYHAIRASVEGCGKWTKDLTDSTQNKNYHNFGCATQNNLASMIANPSDLIGPRGRSEIDAARRARAIETYREGNDSLSGPPNATFGN